MPELVVASFNVHAGVDGWGRPHDVVGACRRIDADVLILQESWDPDSGTSVARSVADALGYTVEELVVARGWLASGHGGASRRWGPRFRLRRTRALLLDGRHRRDQRGGTNDGAHGGPPRSVSRGSAARRWQHGSWGVAVLSRLPVRTVRRIDLGKLRRDRGRRGALQVHVDAGGTEVVVVGTHLSHLSHGSPVQFRRLARALAGLVGPAVLAGDMNLWGPPVSVLLPGWRRAVRGRTWPAWRRLAQPDHVLVAGRVRVLDGTVLHDGGSDHLPVRCRLAVGDPDDPGGS